ARLQTRADNGLTIWEHRSHGDFAPWNCAWTTRGLFVYDWEDSRARDAAFGDAFHFVAGPAAEVEPYPNPARTLRLALGFARRAATAIGLERIDLNTHFALWALRRAGSVALYGAMLRAH